MKQLKFFSQIAALLLIVFLSSCNTKSASIIKAEDYDHVIKIACVGNSITYGFGIPHRDSLSYPAQLQRMLGDKYEVRNFGVSARTLLSKGDLPWMKEKEYQQALDFKPDVVLIKLGTNDTKPYNWKYKAEYESDYIALVKSFQALSSRPIVVPMKAVPAFPDHWGITDSIIRLELNPKIEKIANQLDLPMIDLYTPLIEMEDLFPDRIHPTAEGATIIAQTIKDRLISE